MAVGGYVGLEEVAEEAVVWQEVVAVYRLLLLQSWGRIRSCGRSGPPWKPGDVWSPLIDIYIDSGFSGGEGLGKVVVVLVLLCLAEAAILIASSCHGGFLVSFLCEEARRKLAMGAVTSLLEV
jgi:hypothetical protein